MAKIIVGIEDSFRSEDAVALTGELARAAGAEISAICAYPFEDAPAAHSNYAMREPLRELAAATLERVCEPLNDLAVEHFAIADLSAARALMSAAISPGADLIVVGSSRAAFHGCVHPGGTAWRLLQGAPCAVAIAPQGHRMRPPFPDRPVVAAFDGSPGSWSALSAAARIADASGRPLRVLRVFARDAPTASVLPGFLRDTEHAEAAAREELEQVVDRYADAQAAFLTGDVAQELSRESEYAALMVLGSRGYGAPGGVLLGAVTGSLVYTAGCPLVILPHEVHPPLGQLFSENAVEAA